MLLCFEDISNEGHIPAFYDHDPLVQKDFLRKAAKDGHVIAMYKLGLECDNLDETKYWLETAARNGYVPAMYAFGLLCDLSGQRRRWLVKAAASGHLGAMYALAMESYKANERGLPSRPR